MSLQLTIKTPDSDTGTWLGQLSGTLETGTLAALAPCLWRLSRHRNWATGQGTDTAPLTFMKTLALIASSFLALLVLAYFCALYVPEAATGVRQKMGSSAEEEITQGMHISIPWVYEIKVFSGAIHISQLGIDVDGHACEPAPPAKLRVLWRIVDARRFLPLVAASPGTSEAALGERQILRTFCALNKARLEASKLSGNTPPNLEDGSIEKLLNESLVPGFGVEVLNMSKSTP